MSLWRETLDSSFVVIFMLDLVFRPTIFLFFLNLSGIRF